MRSTDASLTQQAYRSIRADVLACRMRPGERINIKALADQQSVSLGAVREALSRLTSEGFVVAEPHRGFFVAPISLADLKDLTQVRIKVEKDCMRCSLEHGDVAWEAALVSAFHTLSRTDEQSQNDPLTVSESYTTAHHSFHEALVASCQSRWMLNLRSLLYHQSERYRQLSLPLAKLNKINRNVGEEHRELLDAALARDIDRACLLLAAHLQRTTDVVSHSDAIAETFRPLPQKRARSA